MHLMDLAADVKRGVEESGLIALMSSTNAFSQPVTNHAPCLLERPDALSRMQAARIVWL